MGTGVYEDLRKALIEYDKELAIASAKKVVEQEMDPVKAFEVMTDAIREIGDGFGRGDLWLPDLVGASEAMSSAVPILEEELKKKGLKRESVGIVVLGAVYGDIHTIGKTMVATLLTADGFTVHDLGVSIKPEVFVEAVRKYNADILAMSALMTTTAPEQQKTIELLKKEDLRDKVKVIVGGGALTQDFADSIGADGYDPTAPGAPKLCRRLLGK